MGWSLYINPMYLNPLKGPEPRQLNPDMNWHRPHIKKNEYGEWCCSVPAYLHHGEVVTIVGVHSDLNWAWAIMTDNLLRHNLLPTFAATKGPSYLEAE